MSEEVRIAVPVVAQVVRTKRGRFAPGRSGNPSGRGKGTLNHSTRAAREALRRAAHKAVRILLKQMEHDDNPYVKFGAARLVLERALAEPEDDGKQVSADWVRYATDAELEQVVAIRAACWLRMPDDERPPESYGEPPRALPTAQRVLPEPGEDEDGPGEPR